MIPSNPVLPEQRSWTKAGRVHHGDKCLSPVELCACLTCLQTRLIVVKNVRSE